MDLCLSTLISNYETGSRKEKELTEILKLSKILSIYFTIISL